MPIKRAIALVLATLEDSLDMLEQAQSATPSTELNGILVRRRRAVIVLRNRLSRKDRPVHRIRVAPVTPGPAELIGVEATLQERLDAALQVPGLDRDLTAILRNLGLEAEQARFALAALARRR